jgi:hypothetical protein
MGFLDEQLQGYGVNQRLAQETEANRLERQKEVDLRRPSAIRAEWMRLGGDGMAAAAGQEGLDPIANPEAAVKILEAAPAADVLSGGYGKYTDQPGWMNADQWAKAGGDYAATPGGLSESRYVRSQHLQTPERYEYMQTGPGRLLDLLREKDPDKGLAYWDKSNNARTTRDDYNDPNYNRFAGFPHGAAALVSGVSPLAVHLRNQSVIPNALLAARESDNFGDALERAHAYKNLLSRVLLNPTGEQEVLDLPDGATPEAYRERRKFLGEMMSLLHPPSGATVANDIWRAGSNLGDAVGTFFSMGDRPTIRGPKPQGGIYGGAPAVFADTVETGASMADATLAPEWLSSGLLRGTVREFATDSPIEAAQRVLMPADPQRTYADYLTKPTVPQAFDPERSRQIQQAAAAVQGMTMDNGGLLGGIMTEPQAWTGGDVAPSQEAVRPQSVYRSRQNEFNRDRSLPSR